MATPSGARHRDSEQRFLDLEAAVRSLTAASLRRRQLSVVEGDFVVSGGGGVIINDGGVLRAFHDNGEDSLYVGPVGGPGSAYAFVVEDRSGWGMVRAYEETDGDTKVFLGHETGRPEVKGWGTDVRFDATSDIGLDAGGAIFVNPSGQLQLGLNATQVYVGHTTTGSAANTRLETNGAIQRVTSSLRYKADVRDADIDPSAVLSVRGRTWVEKSDAGSPDAKRNVGFIAEELDAAGLTEFVEYDDEGRPDAIQYDRLSVGLLAVVKSQQAQLDALSARLDALETVA